MESRNFASCKGMADRLIWVFCFGVIFFSIPGFALAQEKPVGKIIGIIGTVEALIGEPVAQAKKGEPQRASAEVWEKIKKNQAVYTKDTFRTGRKSRLKIVFEDKSLMALGPKTRMSIESYLYKPEDKLRQGVINVAHGLSMYIVNKSQKNKDSSFQIVSPTGNLAARGTQGYISASANKTLIANQAGTVLVRNIDPNVGAERKSKLFEFREGYEPFLTTAAFFDEDVDLFAQIPGSNDVPLGPMTKTVILEGQPPSPPVPLTPGELNVIRNVVLAKIGGSAQNRNLIDIEEKKGKKKKKKKKQKKSKGSDDSSSESSDSESSAGSEEGGDDSKGSKESKGSDDGGGDTDVDSGFMSEFVDAGLGGDVDADIYSEVAPNIFKDGQDDGGQCAP